MEPTVDGNPALEAKASAVHGSQSITWKPKGTVVWAWTALRKSFPAHADSFVLSSSSPTNSGSSEQHAPLGSMVWSKYSDVMMPMGSRATKTALQKLRREAKPIRLITKQSQRPTACALLFVEPWAKCIGIIYTSLYVYTKVCTTFVKVMHRKLDFWSTTPFLILGTFLLGYGGLVSDLGSTHGGWYRLGIMSCTVCLWSSGWWSWVHCWFGTDWLACKKRWK